MKKTITISLISILGLHLLGIVYDLYHVIWWYDIPMHILGGAWVALFFFHFFYQTWHVVDLRKILFTLIITLGFVVLVGVLWEFYEYLSDVYLLKIHPLGYAPNPLTLPDTLKDLLDDLIGGAVASLILLFRIKKT
mgnify:FL=1